MQEYQILEDDIVIGRFQERKDRDNALSEHCKDFNHSYLVKDVKI